MKFMTDSLSSANGITVINESDKEITIDSYKSEILALTEEESVVGDKKNWTLPNIYVETDYAFRGQHVI